MHITYFSYSLPLLLIDYKWLNVHFKSVPILRGSKRGGGASILMYTHYMKKPKYTYTLIYINIHKLSFYSALSVNHIMHLNDVFEELLHCINSFDGRFVDI